MKQSMLSILGLILLLSCSNNVQNDSDYLGKISNYNKEMTTHFPKAISYKYLSVETDTDAYYNTENLIVTLVVSEAKVNELLDKYKNQLIQNDDPKIKVVNSFLTRNELADPETVFCGEDCIDKTPLTKPIYILPNFYLNKFEDSTTLTKLSSRFVHIELDKRKGIFSTKINPARSSMPIGFFHGYSKGISISKEDNAVIYWLIIF
ncbi:hypothetical protein D3C71_140780 [compost metagenome]